MKKIILLICLASSVVFNHSFSLDTTAAKYMPLQIGNIWTYYVYRNFSPGPGYQKMAITNTQVFNNHLYYSARTDEYFIYNSNHYVYTHYFRIDSATGNLYKFDTQSNIDCLYDSLSARKNDSAKINCPTGYSCKYDTASFLIFNQYFHTKVSDWLIPIEVSGQRKYSRNLGIVYQRGQAMMSITELSLRGCLINGILRGDTSVILGVNQISTEIPQEYILLQNYPNPFNPVTRFGFRIADFGLVCLTVFDVLGKVVELLVYQHFSPGTYEVDFDGSNLPSGVYYYRLDVSTPLRNNFTQTKKMVLIK